LIDIRQTRYRGVVIATSTIDHNIRMIIPSLSITWSHTSNVGYGDESYWSNQWVNKGVTDRVVQLGSAFDCTMKNEPLQVTKSMIDLSQTKWQVDITNTKWSQHNQDGNDDINNMKNKGVVDITNPSRVTITANGCGSTTIGGNGYIIITEVIPNDVPTCEAVVRPHSLSYHECRFIMLDWMT
jgi:hypothetical protein